jgi:alpha-tubulin suppressor-like RCC1 family protein
MDCPAAGRLVSRRSPTLAVAASLVALFAIACDSTEPRRAVALGVVAQPPATAQSGIALAQAPVVELRDRDGAPFAQPDVMITASIVGGGTLGGTVTRATDAQGRAAFPDLVIAGTVGPRTLRFSASGLTEVTSTPIELGAGAAATLQAVSRTTIAATVGAAVTSPPSVAVRDASGNPVPGVSVGFTFGSIGAWNQTTDAAGVATMPGWTLPTTAGEYTVVAQTAAVPASTVTFTVTATPDSPSHMEPTGGGQSVLYGSRLPTPLEVKVTDQYGNATPGVVVTWGSVSGAGTVEPINVATDAEGIVRSNYRLGTTPGANVIRASISSRGLSVDFDATALGFTTEMDVSGLHSCALDESGAAYCWGQNNYGQLGDGTTERRSSPTRVSGTLRFRRISTGGYVTCALTTDNVPYCWGFGTYGALGNGATTHRPQPTPVSGGHRFTEIEAGEGTTCGLTSTGAAYCWGSNQSRQLGIGTGVPAEICTDPWNPGISFGCSLEPMQVTGGLAFKSITVGFAHVCALTSASSELYCWGLGWPYGSQGTVNGGFDPAPVRVAPTFTFEKITATTAVTCGIAEPTSAYCWGSGSDGELGNGTEDAYQATPGLVSGIAVVDLHAGGTTCAVVTDGRAFCWGFNDYGSVGDGTTTDRLTPATVVSGLTFTTVRASIYHSCGRVTNGQIHCWGANLEGELGVGDGTPRLTPTLARP